MKQTDRPTTIPADPEQWTEENKQTLSYHFIREYTDKPYKCWRCHAESVFTAQDQKYTYEVKKANIDQQRLLCATCWSESHQIRAALEDCEEQWSAGKPQLQSNKPFLSRWLELLVALEAYVPYKPDTAKKNMLTKLLGNA
ncbi:zinc-ribbon domain-containing protein [Methylibium petroleiphilum]|uniref:Probable zinc-binding domain-containing protein n=1 Tax=Methylibium petroleiphilum (strain ATCC BAA-1232 / LMG 22953 / PM1) TaxID=420662 RepID=A2SCP5_METPP|nr:zinc-ribbon domain-containing protein [Methylibium petroleiphilum]ABM93334.1 hypothetical protein Mpe_A0372 [Methylibium petroleiphilum PM1]